MNTGLRLLATLVAIAVIPGAVSAQSACGDRAKIIDQLQNKYLETHRASGLESDTKMVEIWTARDNSTWTILITRANGVTCVAAAGRNWLDLPATTAQLGQPS